MTIPPSRPRRPEQISRFRAGSETASGPERSISGASAVEFAIIAPLLFMILLGLLVYGLYFGTAHSVQQLAADAARASVAGLNDAERNQLANQHAQASASNYLLIDGSKLQVDAAPDAADGSIFVVTVTYDASELPIYGLDQLVPVPQPTIRRSAAIRRGGY